MKTKILVALTIVLIGCSNLRDSQPPESSRQTKPITTPIKIYEDLNIATNIDGLKIAGYQLLRKTPVGNTSTDYTVKALISSQAEQPLFSVSGALGLAAQYGGIIDSNVIFGDVYPGSTSLSKTTFTLRLDNDQPFPVQAIRWQLTGSRSEVVDQSSYPAEVRQRFEELYQAGEFLPQFVLGDVNEDGVVDEQDKAQITQYVEQAGESALGCAAAGDLTGDARIDKDDIAAFDLLKNGKMVIDGTKVPINLPLFYTQPVMPCGLNDLFFAASPAVIAGGMASLFFLDKSIRLDKVDIEVIAGQVEIAANQLAYGLNLVTANTMKAGEKVILKIAIPGRGAFLYAFPILTPLAEFTLSTVVNDEDGDSPRDTPPPTIYGEEDGGDECPVKDDGCEALLIDFFRHGAFYDKNMHTQTLIESKLKGLGCNVIAVYPSYLRSPIFGSLFTGGGAQNKYINRTNQTTLANINKAIDRHAKRLAAGKALGIQIVLGHGDNMGWGVSFDAPAGPVWGTNPTVSRKSLHQKVYDAEFSTDEFRVCGNIAMDFSCQSGYTAINIQSVNNTGSVSKAPAGTRDHTLHAGYDMDVGRGEAVIGSVSEGTLAGQVKKLSAALDAEIKDRKNENPTPPRYKRLRERIKNYSKSYSSSYMYYIDGGYKDADYDHSEKLR